MFAESQGSSEAYPARAAKRRRTIAAVKTHPFFGERIDIFCADALVAITAEIISPILIRCQNQEVVLLQLVLLTVEYLTACLKPPPRTQQVNISDLLI